VPSPEVDRVDKSFAVSEAKAPPERLGLTLIKKEQWEKEESSPLKRLPVKPNSMSGAAWAHIVAGVWQNGSADGNSRR